MTSEIAVMNQRAVALAADSAVTLIDGGTVVVRNDQRKLFNLIEHRPVGVMFFGVADILGHPCSSLRLGKRTTTIGCLLRSSATFFISASTCASPAEPTGRR